MRLGGSGQRGGRKPGQHTPPSEGKVLQGEKGREQHCHMLPGNQQVEDSEGTIGFRSKEDTSHVGKVSFCGVEEVRP